MNINYYISEIMNQLLMCLWHYFVVYMHICVTTSRSKYHFKCPLLHKSFHSYRDSSRNYKNNYISLGSLCIMLAVNVIVLYHHQACNFQHTWKNVSDNDYRHLHSNTMPSFMCIDIIVLSVGWLYFCITFYT